MIALRLAKCVGDAPSDTPKYDEAIVRRKSGQPKIDFVKPHFGCVAPLSQQACIASPGIFRQCARSQ
jgi:hypothetical protein